MAEMKVMSVISSNQIVEDSSWSIYEGIWALKNGFEANYFLSNFMSAASTVSRMNSNCILLLLVELFKCSLVVQSLQLFGLTQDCPSTFSICSLDLVTAVSVSLGYVWRPMSIRWYLWSIRIMRELSSDKLAMIICIIDFNIHHGSLLYPSSHCKQKEIVNCYIEEGAGEPV